jgi:hypothetical protein
LEQQGKWKANPSRKSSKKPANGQEPKSAMIELEKQALEKMKIKQQLEIEKMLGAEFTKKQIEQRNTDKQATDRMK